MAFNLSLQHTEPKLSWDADDDHRKRTLHKKWVVTKISKATESCYIVFESSAARASNL